MQCDCHECDSKRYKAMIDVIPAMTQEEIEKTDTIQIATDLERLKDSWNIKPIKFSDVGNIPEQSWVVYKINELAGMVNALRRIVGQLNQVHKAEEQEKEYRRKFARSGGLATSDAKTKACRKNGKKGGWKKGRPRGKRTAGGSVQAGVTWQAMEAA